MNPEQKFPRGFHPTHTHDPLWRINNKLPELSPKLYRLFSPGNVEDLPKIKENTQKEGTSDVVS